MSARLGIEEFDLLLGALFEWRWLCVLRFGGEFVHDEGPLGYHAAIDRHWDLALEVGS